MAKKPKAPRKQPARRTAARADAAQLPVHQTLTPSAPFELKASEIERALVTGEHSQLLERYFGAERYAEMQDLSRKATTRSVRGAPRVYILPGIMGSTLGSPRPFFLDDVIWIDPIDIARGELTSLALLPGAAKHQALSVILLAYLRLKLTLRIAGYDADFFAYDWRLSMDELGRRLSEQLAKDPAAKISLVAHSMGGLVSRAALTHGAGKLERLIMLGTPNHGSFNAVQALRGVYSVMKGRNLVVVHDAIASRIPWETLDLGGWQPALDAGLSRRYLAENLSIAKWLEERRHDTTLSILLVVNPTGDLDGATAEGDRIAKLLATHPSVSITERRNEHATKPALLADFLSGKYDVIHYAGHAFFDPARPARSGILCAGRTVLSGEDLVGLSKLPSLVFFNACESGRTRRSPDEPKNVREQVERNVGLAEAFLRGGAANYVGTYWPVGDASAKDFAEKFSPS